MISKWCEEHRSYQCEQHEPSRVPPMRVSIVADSLQNFMQGWTAGRLFREPERIDDDTIMIKYEGQKFMIRVTEE